MSRKSGAFDGLIWIFKGIFKAIAAIFKGFIAIARYFILAIDSIIHEDKRW
jgi:hypothetical protein